MNPVWVRWLILGSWIMVTSNFDAVLQFQIRMYRSICYSFVPYPMFICTLLTMLHFWLVSFTTLYTFKLPQSDQHLYFDKSNLVHLLMTQNFFRCNLMALYFCMERSLILDTSLDCVALVDQLSFVTKKFHVWQVMCNCFSVWRWCVVHESLVCNCGLHIVF